MAQRTVELVQATADEEIGTAFASAAEDGRSSPRSAWGWLLGAALLLSCVCLTLLSFRAGQRWEMRKQYELIR